VTKGVGDAMPEVTTLDHRSESAGTAGERRITVIRNSARPLSDSITIRNAVGQPIEQRTARGMRNQIGYGARGFAETVAVTVAGGSGSHVTGASYDPMGRSLRQAMGPSGAPNAWTMETTPTPGGFEDVLELRYQGDVVHQMTIEERHPSGMPTNTLFTTFVDGVPEERRVRQPRDGGGQRVSQAVEWRDPVAGGELVEFRSGQLAQP
jgi:hypothetical protein